MAHRLGVCSVLAVFGGFGVFGCSKSFSGPEEGTEVKKAEIKVDLPAVPAFDLPAAPGDGSQAVKELRVKGKKLLDSEITVKGVVTWAYDCMTEIRKPGESDKDVAKAIEDDPTKCQRAKFYIGDDPSTPPEKSIWVVDVPRPLNKLELKNGPKDQLKTLQHMLPEGKYPDRCDPAEKDPKKSICPPYKVGDKVTITGWWKLSSPHSERNSDGLLVYKKMKNETAGWETPELLPPEPPPAGAAGATGPAKPAQPSGPAKPSPEDLVNKGKKKGA